MTRPASEADISTLVAPRYGPALSVTRCSYGHNSRVYDVTLTDRHLIVRTHIDPDVFAGTAANLQILTGLNLPVPVLIEQDLTCARVPFAYMILKKIPGVDLGFAVAGMTRAQMSGVAARVAEFQQLVATLPPGKGYGWTPIDAPGPFDNWQALIDDMLARSIQAATPHVSVNVLATTANLIEGLAPYLQKVPPVCFLDDLTVKNVIVKDGVLRGVVDFDCVCYGDPLLTIALAQTGMIFDIGEPGRYYIDELCRHYGVDEEARRIVDCYSLVMALEFLSYDPGNKAANRRSLAAISGWTHTLAR